MKRRKAKSVVPPFPGPDLPSFPGEADPFSAMEGLRRGIERPVGYFVSDVAKVLSVLAALLGERRFQFSPHPPAQSAHVTNKVAWAEEDSEWVGTLDQVEQAIEIGSGEA